MAVFLEVYEQVFNRFLAFFNHSMRDPILRRPRADTDPPKSYLLPHKYLATLSSLMLPPHFTLPCLVLSSPAYLSL